MRDEFRLTSIRIHPDDAERLQELAESKGVTIERLMVAGIGLIMFASDQEQLGRPIQVPMEDGRIGIVSYLPETSDRRPPWMPLIEVPEDDDPPP